MKILWKSIIGPNLYKIYPCVLELKDCKSKAYVANSMEKFGSCIMQGISTMLNVGFYTSPLIIWYFYRRDYFCISGGFALGKVATGITLLYIIGMLIRGFGRYSNSSYITFLNSLENEISKNFSTRKGFLSRYDFDLSAWKVDFTVKGIDKKGDSGGMITSTFNAIFDYFSNVCSSVAGRDPDKFLWLELFPPCHLAAYLCIHLFGRHLIYPGSIRWLQTLLEAPLSEGREKLIVENGGLRFKVETLDGNFIDTLFVDRRDSEKCETGSTGESGFSEETPVGSTLVICCEGNAGFYEIGLMSTPLDAGYSVLGWNHPGFAASTGKPFPAQEKLAVEAVVQFAIEKLGFSCQDILIYAWSIGGFTGAYAAKTFPEIGGLVLDATFDDVVPLAVPRMPSCMAGLVSLAVRKHMNLNVAEQLQGYHGPVTVIRRTKDEIIASSANDIASNRGNNLLVKLLRHRFPALVASPEAAQTLSLWAEEDEKMQESIYENQKLDETSMEAMLASCVKENGARFPSKIGQDLTDPQKTHLLLYLANKILVNVNGGHNNPLESKYLKKPWSIPDNCDEATFVQL